MSFSLSSSELEGMLLKIEERERGGTYAESGLQAKCGTLIELGLHAKGGTLVELGSQGDIFSSNFTFLLMIRFLDFG